MDYLFWQAMAQVRIGDRDTAQQQFHHFIQWGQAHRDCPVEADFFAVSLPDLIALNGDPGSIQRQHCLFVEALGHLGLGDMPAFERLIRELLVLNPAHDKAHLLAAAQRAGVFA